MSRLEEMYDLLDEWTITSPNPAQEKKRLARIAKISTSIGISAPLRAIAKQIEVEPLVLRDFWNKELQGASFQSLAVRNKIKRGLKKLFGSASITQKSAEKKYDF